MRPSASAPPGQLGRLLGAGSRSRKRTEQAAKLSAACSSSDSVTSEPSQAPIGRNTGSTMFAVFGGLCLVVLVALVVIPGDFTVGALGPQERRSGCTGPNCDHSTELQKQARKVVHRVNRGGELTDSDRMILQLARQEVVDNPELAPKKAEPEDPVGPKAGRKSRYDIEQERIDRRREMDERRELRQKEREFGLPAGYLSKGKE